MISISVICFGKLTLSFRPFSTAIAIFYFTQVEKNSILVRVLAFLTDRPS